MDRIDRIMAVEVEGEAQVEVAVAGNADQFDWDELIELHLNRQAVERGLSRNSLEAYGGDLRDFQNFCRDRGVAPRELDAALEQPTVGRHTGRLSERASEMSNR